jgi:dTMP kinase
MKKIKGTFIVIDGTDGSGKATQTKLLHDYLVASKKRVGKIDFPRYETNLFGQLLHEALKQGKHGDFIAISPKIASTIYAADRFESANAIRKWLDSGYTIITDRYASANQIHQGGKIRDAKERKEFLVWLDRMEFEIFNIPRPDIIVYLHVPITISLELIRRRAEETNTSPDQAEADGKHLLESQASALKLIEKNNNWIKINCARGKAMRAREAIHKEIVDRLTAAKHI